MRIDAHQHFWAPARDDYGWLTPESGPLYRDYQPADLKSLLDAAGIDRTILVQAAPTEEETHYLLDLATQHDWVAGVVGWVDLAAPDAPERIAALAARPRLRGLRPMLQDLDDPHWIERPELAPALMAMVRHGLVFDALIRPHQLSSIAVLADRNPDLAIVIDHAAKPAIGGATGIWATAMRTVATRANVHVKLSGLLTEAPIGADAATLLPIVTLLLDAFGAERILWGSDWPVLTLAGDYRHWLGLSEELLGGFDRAARAAVFGGNAHKLYGLIS